MIVPARNEAGNIEEIGWLKLEVAGLRTFFRFGAFGDESDHRADLVRLAVDRARATIGIDYAGEQIWIIGDTPRDIACARSAGTKVVAVATGRWSAEQLAEHRPDALLADLTDADKFMSAIS